MCNTVVRGSIMYHRNIRERAMNIKQQVARQLASNNKLNRQALSLSRSWDEVSSILNGKNVQSGKKCRPDCKKKS